MFLYSSYFRIKIMGELEASRAAKDGELVDKLEQIVKVTLNPWISICLSRRDKYSLIDLVLTSEGMEKANHAIVKLYWEFITTEFTEFGMEIARASVWRIVFANIDRWYQFQVSSLKSKRAQIAWADNEAKKTHHLLTYVRRQCARSKVSRSAKIRALKKMLLETWKVEFKVKIREKEKEEEKEEETEESSSDCHDQASEVMTISSSDKE